REGGTPSPETTRAVGARGPRRLAGWRGTGRADTVRGTRPRGTSHADALAEGLAGLERGVLHRGNLDLLAGRRVAACAGGAALHAEGAEAGDGDLLAAVELGGDDALAALGAEDRVDDLEGLGLGDTDLLGELLRELGLVHGEILHLGLSAGFPVGVL